MDYLNIITEIYENVQKYENKGEVATYIPELGKVHPNKFGVCLSTVTDETFNVGDAHEKFSIQSIAKVFSLVLAYKIEGPKLWKRVGVEPSGTSFNSLVQLEYENGIPRNPFINSGAIVICDVLASLLENPKEDLLAFIRKVSNNEQLTYSERIVASEKATGFKNAALINLMSSFQNITNDIDLVLDLYYNLCSIKMTCKELSSSLLFLANNGKITQTQEEILSKSQVKRINAIMQTCGFYDEAGEFSYKVGLPGKSGVGGGILAILPHNYSIVVWSPKLNKKGNSYRGINFLELFTTKTASSVF
jgi:glutaminase